MKNILSYIICLLTFSVSIVHAQTLKAEDEMVLPVLVTDSGTLAVYYVNTPNTSKCIVQNMITEEKWVLENVQNKMLVTDTQGVFYNTLRKEIYRVDFKANKTDTLTNVTSFDVIAQLYTLVYFNGNTNTLTLTNIKNNTTETLTDISYYHLDTEVLQVLYLDTNGTLGRKDLIKEKIQHYVGFELTGQQLKHVKWDAKAKTAYLFGLKNQELYLYELTNKLLKIGTYPITNTKEHFTIDTLFSSVHILPNHQLVLGVKAIIEAKVMEENVESWSGSEKGFTPMVRFFTKHQNQLVAIDLKSGVLTSLLQPGTFMRYRTDENGNLYRYEFLEHDDTTMLDPPITLHKYDFNTKQFTVINTFSGNLSNLLSYKDFPHWVFFKNNHWYYFDEKLNKEVGITESTNEAFYNEQHEYYKITGDESLSTPLARKGKGFYINDLKDIWYYDWKTKQMTRKTDGKTDKKKYALCDCNHDLKTSEFRFRVIEKPFDDLILTWTAGLHELEGIDVLKENGTQQNIAMDKAHFSKIKRFKNHLMFVKEKVNQPPVLYLYDLKADKQKMLYESNKWDTLSSKIVSEHFYWYNKNKEFRGGMVRFPKSYKENDTIKYPVVVNIYEKKFKVQNTYISPNEPSANGINFREYTQDDYFVIEPDIYYEIGETGASALKCITEALDVFESVFPLDVTNMGVYGHSFGGYETNYVITQTPRFKAAASCAGVADAVSTYFTYSPEYFRADMWRYETQQWRIGKSFFESPELYIKNSPIYHAQNITTPLMLIAGDKDYVINWQQSLYMFSALKRLQKPVHLLLYKNEGHTIETDSNELDVSTKTKEWFDYYLKGKEKPKWL